jgi:hypothetical protein
MTRRQGLLYAIPLAALVCFLLAARIVDSLDYHHNDNDFFTFWLAGHLVTQGDSPYDTAAWADGYRQFDMAIQPNPAFLYPLPLALLYTPLGLMSFHTAYIFWDTLLGLMILAALILLLDMAAGGRSKMLFLPILAGLVFFRPAALTLIQGQASGLFLFVLAVAALLWRREKPFWSGALLGLLALKPNLGGPLLLLLVLWILRNRRYNAFAGMAAAGAVLLAAGLIYQPRWIADYWQVGTGKLAQTFGGSPTVWGLGALVCRNGHACTLSLGGVAAALIVAVALWTLLRRRDLPILTALGLAVTVTLLVTPYTWTYDQLLLLVPIVLIVTAVDGPRLRLLLASSIFLLIDLVTIVLLFFNVLLRVEILNAVIPLIVLGLYVLPVRQSLSPEET